jgi:hypothetical protein
VTQSPVVTHNRILLTDPGPFRKIVAKSDTIMMSRDSSFLPYLIDELVAQSALKLVIPKGTVLAACAVHLPGFMQRHVEIVDSSRAFSRAMALLAPVFKEFGVTEATEGMARLSRGTPREVLVLYQEFPTFVRGLEHKTEIAIDFAAMKEATRVLRGLARSHRARIALAQLEGVFNTYEDLEVPMIEAIPRATEAHDENFRRLLEDYEYAELSAEAHNLGVGALSRRAAQLMRRTAMSVVSRTPFREIFNLGTKVITVWTKAPMPDSETVSRLLRSSYMPPIVRTKDAYRRAERAWETDAPEFIPPTSRHRRKNLESGRPRK